MVMLSMEKVLLMLFTLASSCTLPSLHFVHAFSSFSRTVSSTANATPRTTKAKATVADSSCTDNASPVSHEDTVVINENGSTSYWATYALLFSSLGDGILPNNDARSFLRYSLVNSILREHIVHKESLVESSVKFSPCNGPNTDTLNNMEHYDLLLERGRTLFPYDENNTAADSWSEETLCHLLTDTGHELDLRVLYIPTAMYALNPQSTNTPGKQRQRARSDGKQRRDQLLNLLNDIFSSSNSGRGQEQIKLLTVTLDLDDGSLKHPYGSENKALFPENDIAAFTTWQPHLIYVEGGNTFWLQHCIDKGGYAQLLKDACTGSGSAVYCGKSAGAIVAGERVDTATWKEWDDPSIVSGMGSYSDWINCRGMEFVGQHSFFPHMSDAWSETVRDKVNSHNYLEGINSVYCLREHDACCVMGERKLVFLTSGQEAINANSSH